MVQCSANQASYLALALAGNFKGAVGRIVKIQDVAKKFEHRQRVNACAWAVIDTQLDTPPALIGASEQGAVDFCKSHYRLLVVPEETDFEVLLEHRVSFSKYDRKLVL